MGKIVLLDDLSINQIAAGEVIERPANVVKELVENSVDAGATKITVEIKKGGKSFIKITDNGKGIEKEDLPLSIERHATSKIRSVEDLEHTYTMGFRGEALASIASISNFTIISKTDNQEIGIKITTDGGDIVSAEEVSSNTGTTIIVENIFFNTPVRYKFLKNDSTEFRYIKEWLQKFAVSHLDVSIKLINDGKIVFSSNGNGSIDDLIYVLYGKDVQENIIKVDYEDEGIKVSGVIGTTLIARDTRKDQIVFLNKRNIKNNILTASADQAFKGGGTGIGKFGFFILNLDMPASYYDINVHPTKMDVRFKDEDKIFKVFYNAIKSAMLSKEFLGNTEMEERKTEYIEKEYNFVTNHFIKQPSIIPSKEIDTVEEKSIIERENKRKVEYKYIGILFRTYIVIEVGKDIYLIDQHAAHERLLYEQIKENYKNNLKNNTQMTLIPEIINLTHKECEFVKENIELFQKAGFDIEEFGDNSVKINGIPDIEYREKTTSKDLFMDTLDEMLTSERSQGKDIEERFIATVACKAAVKANMDLTKMEVDKLIDNLLVLKNPYTCPHGRPTTIKFNKDEFTLENI
ncbi:MAG: DNA mismatch repair endonuclease MutL [Clostridia bacterium]|nr:DNA mismatch repair endonuclease MutL [Clostridia bacterium]